MTRSDDRSERPKVRITVRDRRASREGSDAPEGEPADEAASSPTETGTAEPERTRQPEAAGEPAPDPVALGAELEEAWRLASERLDQLKRLKADYENLRQRSERERVQLVDRAASGLVQALLPVVDDLDRALESAREQPGMEPLLKGVELVHRQFHEVLGKAGVERIDPLGAEFDPHEHEALGSLPGDVNVPTVTEVVRNGYRMKGKTIRPALVFVTTPASADAPGEQSQSGFGQADGQQDDPQTRTEGE